jgi:hypothetical protein
MRAEQLVYIVSSHEVRYPTDTTTISEDKIRVLVIRSFHVLSVVKNIYLKNAVIYDC